MKPELVIKELERRLNESLKTGNFVEFPDELLGMDCSFLWDELRSSGFKVELNEDWTKVRITEDRVSLEEVQEDAL